jgi:leukotriene-A4 hydrolase
MSLIPRLLVAAIVAVPATPGLAAPQRPAVSPILLTPEAVDKESYAKPRTARVTHVDLDLSVDFQAKVVSGSASLDVLAASDAREIVLDTSNLTILKVTDAKGNDLPWTLGAADTSKSSPLIVQLKGSRRIVVTYRSGNGAIALQWLPPTLTAGKRKPYLYSQGEPTNNRSWIPTQDSPGIRQTWTARIVVPQDLVAVMSAERLSPTGEPAGLGRHAYRFRMTHPVPPYLIALAVGDLTFRSLGPRTGVFTEPSMMDRAAAELVDTEKMVSKVEGLYGPYRWGRYDVLVLPPAFPLGGMENANLTFLTPTFITGDRANISVVAHELAHSWSGNLVTNATWPDLWLNEGFTSYVENRAMEALYGRERAEIEADLTWDSIQAAFKQRGGPKSDATRLYGEPGGQLEYSKGETFLRTIETIVGRARWDAYLRDYFDRHAFQPQTTAGFLADLRIHVIKGDPALEAKLRLDEWAYEPGLPDNAVHVRSAALARVDSQVTAFAKGAPASSIPARGWTTQEWQRFLNNLPRKLAASQLADLDGAFQLSASTNANIRAAWLELAIANRYGPALPSLESFLMNNGRGIFIRPLYLGLLRQGDWGKPLARRYFAEARDGYHPIVASTLAALVESP